jgi:hypothetical protein
MRLRTGPGMFSGLKKGAGDAKAGFQLLNQQLAKSFKSASLGGIFSKIGNGLVSLAKGFVQAALGALRLGMALVTTPIGLITIAVVALVAAFVMMWKKSEKLREAVSNLGKHLMGSLGKAFQSIKDYIAKFIPPLKNVGSLFKTMGDWVAKYVVPILQFLGDILIKVGAFLIKVFLTPILLVIKGIMLLVQAIKAVYDWFQRLTGDAVEPLSKAQKKAAEAAKQHAAQLKQTRYNAAELDKKFKNTGAIYQFLTDKATSAFKAATSHARSLIATNQASKQLRETDKTLTDTLKDSTVATIDKESALYEFAGAYMDAAEQATAAGKSSDYVQKIIEKGRSKFIKGAAAIGMGATAAKKLATNLGLTNSVIEKTFKVNGLDDLRALTGQLETLNQMTVGTGKTFDAAVADWKKKHKMTADEEKAGGKGYQKYTERAKGAVRSASAKVATEVKSAIAVKMEMSFGAGQNRGKPMFVNVVNPIAVGTGTAGNLYTGGQVKGGSTYLVGERGPELFQAPTSGNIVPNHQVGMGNTINLTVNPSPGMDERELANIMSRKLAFLQRGA